MLKSELLRLLQQEIRRHDFSYFIDEPPSMAQGGRGVCVPGCPSCRKQLQTMNQFIDHLPNDVLPKIIQNVSRELSNSVDPGHQHEEHRE